MSDIIKLLPDNVANQIAAGEVVQRPASVVKELMENAVDAGADSIKLIIKDAGKLLIQIIDNGCGMSETDARMSFERHATSKLKEANDLFAIKTMGFRGEALASIASIAQVEMKTKRKTDEVGLQLINEGGTIISQEPCLTSDGTSISVKNLFYNVPARRNFLKSNTVELSHIFTEFYRVVLSFPHIAFALVNNNQTVYQLDKGNFKQRIVALYGNNYNERLLPVEQFSDVVNISGFVVKPEFCKKTKGEQFFFANKRFIKHAYLHHAVQNAYEELLPVNTYSSYFLWLDLNPARIDVNIHPTKTEIKFQDEKEVYTFLKSAVKQSLGMHNIIPTLDFQGDPYMNILPPKDKSQIKKPEIKFDPNYNPFKTQKNTYSSGKSNDFAPKRHSFDEWEKLHDFNIESQLDNIKTENTFSSPVVEKKPEQQVISSDFEYAFAKHEKKIFQIHNSFIISQVKSGMMLIDQQSAHERILFEKFLHFQNNKQVIIQQKLFPKNILLNDMEFMMMMELKNDLHEMGFDLREFGHNTFVVEGTPVDVDDNEVENIIIGFLENFKQTSVQDVPERHVRVAKAMAKNLSIKKGKQLHIEEMNHLINELFACKNPNVSCDGKPTIVILTLDELEKKFKNY